MDNDPRLGPPFPSGARPPLLARIVGFAAGVVILGAALFFSAILFAVLLVVGVIVGAWLWWQTREVRGVLREQMREAQRAQERARAHAPGRRGEAGVEGDVIEGDYIREAPRGDAPPR